MTDARECALIVLEKVLKDNEYSNTALNEVLKNNRLNEKDRALTTEIVYGTLKYKYTIDSILSYFLKLGFRNLSSKALNILRMSIYQLRYLDRVPDFAVTNEAVNLSKKFCKGFAKLVNAVLRNYLRCDNTEFTGSSNFIKKLCFTYSFEEWMVKLFLNQYGNEVCERILKGLNYNPNITVRVNNLKSNYDDTWNKLHSIGYDIEDGYVCPEAISIIKGSSIEKNLLFKEGCITVQDESAMLAAPALDPHANMLCIDLCAAPGGKTTHISELMMNTGTVLAYDVHPSKLKFIKENCLRLGITNVKCSVMDACKLNDTLIDKADRVLIDVPCSGFGIIRKKPEIKWNKNEKNIDSLINIQRRIMHNAAKYVKVGGILLYCTCTLNKMENGDNIDWFIKNNKNYKLESLYFGNNSNFIYDKEGYVTILPDKRMDGFFMAKMKRQW